MADDPKESYMIEQSSPQKLGLKEDVISSALESQVEQVLKQESHD